MSEHECVFVEEQEPSGRLVLPPCIVCGVTAMDALDQLREHLEAREAREQLHLNEIGRHIREREELGDLLGELAYEGRIKGHGDPVAEVHDPTGTLSRLNQALGLLTPVKSRKSDHNLVLEEDFLSEDHQ